MEFHSKGERVIYGPENPLSEQGRDQIRDLALQLQGASIEAIYSSPYLRTRQTAEILGEAFSIPEIIVEENLHDIYAPGWIGFSYDELIRRYAGDIYSQPPKTEDQETLSALFRRVTNAFSSICQKEQGKTFAIVSHGDSLRVLMHHIRYPKEALPPYNELVRSDYLNKGEAWKIVFGEQYSVQEISSVGREGRMRGERIS